MTDKDISKKAEEQQPPKLPNWIGFHCNMFQWGPTKNAVILRDMALAYTAIAKSKSNMEHAIVDAEATIGNAFSRVNEMLTLVSDGFRTLPPILVHEKDDEWKTIPNTKGFKEHLVYHVVDVEEQKLWGRLPNEMVKLFRAVCKENINMRKAKLGIVPKRVKGAYSTQEVVNWASKPYIEQARAKWKQQIGKNMAGRLWAK